MIKKKTTNKLCACGCRLEVKEGYNRNLKQLIRYRRGHYNRGKKPTPETRRKQRLSKLGRKNANWKGGRRHRVITRKNNYLRHRIFYTLKRRIN